MSRSRTVALLLAFLTLMVYLPVRQFGFVVFDDPDYVLENRHVLGGLSWEGVRWAFTSFDASNWHPLTWLSLMLDCELFGPNPAAMHVINVLFHVLNSTLLLRLIFRWSNDLWPSAIVATLFALHPLHVESVAWISERKDVLSTFFGLLSLLAYTRFAQSPAAQNPKPTLTIPLSRDFAFAIIWFVLSLLAKPMLVTLPFVFVLLDIWPFNRASIEKSVQLLRLLGEKWAFLILSFIACVITFLAQRSVSVVSLDRLPFLDRIANATVAYAAYIGKTIWPTKLAVIYPLNGAPPASSVIIALLVLAGISAAVFVGRKSAPYLLVGWCWFLGTLVPVIGLVQVGAQALADRYMYVPMIGLLIAFAFGAAHVVRRRRIPIAVAIVGGNALTIGCLFGTFFQLSYWRDSETLFRRALAVTGPNEIAEMNLGIALENAGRKDEALVQYYRALNLNTNRFQTHNDVANLLADLGRHDEAKGHYLRALELKPDAPLAHQNYGTLLAELGDVEAAMLRYEKAAELAPHRPTPHYLMGKARFRQGRFAEAAAHFRTALERDPNDFQALTFLARVLAAAPVDSLRNGTEAVRLAERAVRVTGGQQPFVMDVLAMACAELGKFAEAVAVSQQALELARAADAPDLVAGLEQRLKLYEARQPYREPASTKSP